MRVFLTEVSRDYQQADQQGADDHSAAGPAALGVAEGDELAYTIEDGRVVLTKASPAASAAVFLSRIRSRRSGSGIGGG